MSRSLAFVEVADGVFVLRHPVLDVNTTLIVGDGAALVVDTLSTPTQARELAAAARAITAHPWRLVNTHAHFDHCLGNHTLAGVPPCPVWAHKQAARLMRGGGAAVLAARRRWEREYPELAEAVPVLPPSHTVQNESTVDVGGRAVVLRHLGRGHTDGDLVVSVPDADAVLAGDLVEEGAPPTFGLDSYPLEWPEALAALLRLTGPATVVVPGHGAVVDTAFVAGQHDDLVALAWLIRDGHADGAPVEAVAAKAPFGPAAARRAVERGYAELGGAA